MTLEDFKLRTPEQYKEAQQQAIKNPDAFWTEIANTFQWKTPFEKVDLVWQLGPIHKRQNDLTLCLLLQSRKYMVASSHHKFKLP